MGQPREQPRRLAQHILDAALAEFADKGLSDADYVSDFNAIMQAGVALPFWINGAGIIASLIGIILVRNTNLKDNATLESLLATITNGVWVASAATTGFTALAVALLFKQDLAWKLFGSTVIGLVAGIIIAKFTEYWCVCRRGRAHRCAHACARARPRALAAPQFRDDRKNYNL